MKRFVGRVGHSKNPLLIPEMDLLYKALEQFDVIQTFAICRENDCHVHMYIETDDINEKTFKKNIFNEIYEVLPKFKKTGRGGDQLVTLKVITYDEKKYKELSKEQQINFQCYYIFKDFDNEKKSEYKLYKFDEEEALLCKKLYYDNLSIISKNKKAITGPGKASTIRDKLLNYFNKTRPTRTLPTGVKENKELFLEDILQIVIDFYADELQVAHTTHDIERYTMLLYSTMESNKYKTYMFSKVMKKLE